MLQLEYLEETAGVPAPEVGAPGHRQAGQRVAVLVDEYDKPIPDALATRRWQSPTAISCAASTA